MGASNCRRCQDRGKPKNFGSQPKCAFANEESLFSSENWNCATANAVRDLIDNTYSSTICYSDDYSLVVMPLSCVQVSEAEGEPIGDFLVASWYKQRGTTDLLLIINDGKSIHPSLEQIETILKHLYRG